MGIWCRLPISGSVGGPGGQPGGLVPTWRPFHTSSDSKERPIKIHGNGMVHVLILGAWWTGRSKKQPRTSSPLRHHWAQVIGSHDEMPRVSGFKPKANTSHSNADHAYAMQVEWPCRALMPRLLASGWRPSNCCRLTNSHIWESMLLLDWGARCHEGEATGPSPELRR